METIHSIYNVVVAFFGQSLYRILYTLILVAILLLVAQQLGSVWGRSKLSLAEFSYFSDGKKSVEYGEQFRNEAIQNYQLISGLLTAEAEAWRRASRKKEDDPEAKDRRLADFLEQQALQLSPIEITIQGVNLSSIFNALGRLITPQTLKIAASLFVSEGKKRIYVTTSGNADLRRTHGIYEYLPEVVQIGSSSRDEDAAFRIACFLVWAQWDKDSETKAADPNGVSMDEFCDWARLLQLKRRFQDTDTYRIADVKKEIDLEFFKRQVQVAAHGQIGFQQIYGSLGGVEDFIGDERITLGSKFEASIGSVSDIVKLLSLRERHSLIPWEKLLTENTLSRAEINWGYFHNRMTEECNKADIPEFVLAQRPNIVRVARQNPSTHKIMFQTGIVGGDGLVITAVHPGFFKKSKRHVR